MRDKTEVESLIVLLLDLGTTSREVADTLYSEFGIEGHRYLCASCPVSRYLIDQGIDVGRGVSAMQGRKGYFWIDDDQLLLSEYPALQGVIDFILDFDAGFYIELRKL